jgi:hypothetical protein
VDYETTHVPPPHQDWCLISATPGESETECCAHPLKRFDLFGQGEEKKESSLVIYNFYIIIGQPAVLICLDSSVSTEILGPRQTRTVVTPALHPHPLSFLFFFFICVMNYDNLNVHPRPRAVAQVCNSS